MSPPSPAPEEPRRILILTRALEIGGAERQIVYLAKGLRSLGHEVTVAVFYGGGALENDLRGTGVGLIDLRKGGRWDVAPFLWRLVRAIRSLRPDVCYTFLSGANMLSGLLRPLFPRLKLVWGVRASNMDLSRYDWMSRLFYKIECVLSRRADLIIANSHAGMAYALGNGFPRNRLCVVPNGIDTERFAPRPADRERQRRIWRLNSDTPIAGIIARLDPMKGHDVFLEAAAIVLNRIPEFRFVAVGDGTRPQRRALRDLAGELGLGERLLWVGPTDDSAAAINALDVLCSTSHFGEGFSNSIGEAMACGVPCVVTDVGDSAIVVGETGIVVAPGDVEALAEGILLMWASRGRGAWLDARNRIEQEFSLNAMVQRTETQLQSLLAPISR